MCVYNGCPASGSCNPQLQHSQGASDKPSQCGKLDLLNNHVIHLTTVAKMAVKSGTTHLRTTLLSDGNSAPPMVLVISKTICIPLWCLIAGIFQGIKIGQWKNEHQNITPVGGGREYSEFQAKAAKCTDM